jgi:type I restriction enzyme S subunit
MNNRQIIGDFLKRIKRPITLSPDNEYKLVTIKMNHNGVVLRGLKKGADIKSNMFEVKEGDFILSGIDARNGAFGIVPKDLDGAIVTNDFWYFDIDESIINKNLFLELTSTTWFDDICKKGSDGTTQRIRLQKGKFFNQEITLPPPKKQSLILEKIQNIKSIKDQFVKKNEEQQILTKNLRASIFSEANKGELTKLWRENNKPQESVTHYLKRIMNEKKKLLETKNIKVGKAYPPISPEETPFELPNGWVWCRLGEISINRDELRVPVSKRERDRLDKVYDYYGASGVIDKIDDYTHEGSFLLIGEDGSNLRLRATPIAFEVEGKFWVNNHAHSIQFTESTTQTYIKNYLNGIDLTPYITGGFQPKLSQGNLNSILVPLPAIEEQRVVNDIIKILMRKCEELKNRTSQSALHVENIIKSIVHEVF